MEEASVSKKDVPPPSAAKKDVPIQSADAHFTVQEKAELGAMLLQRFCFLGSFEPTKTHRVGTIEVKELSKKLMEYCKRVEPSIMLRILRTAYESTLFRRDEVSLVHAIYLCGDINPQFKTVLRRSFPTLVKNDKDLFLFCKYVGFLHKGQKVVFNKTVKKAITDWYKHQSADDMAMMFASSRGRNGFTHSALIRLCHISDGVLGTRHLYRSFTQSCTLVINLRDVPLIPTNPKVKERLAKKVLSKKLAEQPEDEGPPPVVITIDSPTSTSEDVTLEELGLLPIEEQDRIRNFLVSISLLRTTSDLEEALLMVKENNLKFEHIPYHLLQFSSILKEVATSISCLELLRCLHSDKIRKHFAKKEILKVLRSRFQVKGGLKDENVDPIMFLMNLDRLSIADPLKPTNNKKTTRGRLVQFSKQLYKCSFFETKPSNLRIHITINTQTTYMRKILRSTKNTNYQFAAVALAFTFFKVEPYCDVFRFTDAASQLQSIKWDKKMEFKDAHNVVTYLPKQKQKQRLYTPIQQAKKSGRVYDLFIVIVPSGARGNKRRSSVPLADHIEKYRKNNKTTTRLVIVDLMRFRRSMKYSEIACENVLEICGLDKHTVPLIYNFALNRFS